METDSTRNPHIFQTLSYEVKMLQYEQEYRDIFMKLKKFFDSHNENHPKYQSGINFYYRKLYPLFKRDIRYRISAKFSSLFRDPNCQDLIQDIHIHLYKKIVL